MDGKSIVEQWQRSVRCLYGLITADKEALVRGIDAILTTKNQHIASLEADLKACAQALKARASFVSKDGVCFCSVRSWMTDRPHEAQCQVALKALDRPGVKAVLATQGGEDGSTIDLAEEAHKR